MKLAVIIPQSKFLGGGPRLALELVQALKLKGHEPVVYTFRYEKGESYYEDLLKGVRVISLPSGFRLKPPKFFSIPLPGMSTLSHYFNDHKKARALHTLIERDTDALLPQSTRSAYLTAYYFKKRIRNIPAVFQMNDLVTIHYSHCESNTAKYARRPIRSFFYRCIDFFDTKIFLSAIDQISVLSNTTRDLAKKRLNRETEVNRSGVDARHFAFREHLPPLPKNQIKLLAHAQFFRHRRFEDAIRALRIIRDKGTDAILTISGDNNSYRSYRDYYDELKALAISLGMENHVSFPGKVSEEVLLQNFYSHDIFVYPNHMQSWGLVVFEAMACGMPAIVSKEAGAHEVLTDQENAVLVEARNPDDLARGILTLINNPALFSHIGKKGAEFVKSEISWNNFAENIISQIEKTKTQEKRQNI
ncbi:MAG: hypothetical protein A2928_00110 [Candidatus Taylorbacteria bacterium RIFCSPLOWO2_01_FULL_45_15b]|uniref:Glycosyl transferase family 1 domain-containing protein n=1 Tax=Candidatus Taylorbacteria bacterium RIFCSPLOWO2_01_FULL_45_15b TaxID=1802319 RepID=A0A1G2N8D7_9BACT|nr:MAG: hypothetical protein A2928_00110 [Candidatus Taylorbacteria bacterium RIFCSPLOWO2_01_FULL_45_15b]